MRMEINKHIFSIAAVVLWALPLNITFAHDFWIEPDNFTPAAGEQVKVRLKEGVGFRGDTLPYIEQWFADFSMTTSDGTEPVISLTGNDPAADIDISNGPALLGYQSIRSFVVLDAAKFNQYLEDEGIEFIRAARQAAGEDDLPAPEYFVRCAKSLIMPEADGGFLKRFFGGSQKAGNVYKTRLDYTLELIPLENPYAKQAGDSLEFELIYRDKPAEGLLIQAFTRELPDEIQKVRTDAAGRATVNLDKTGIWMVKAVQIQPIIGDPKARWQSYWATYLFAVD